VIGTRFGYNDYTRKEASKGKSEFSWRPRISSFRTLHFMTLSNAIKIAGRSISTPAFQSFFSKDGLFAYPDQDARAIIETVAIKT
jgi:hypothetical protein